jgi:hypothetical protein
MNRTVKTLLLSLLVVVVAGFVYRVCTVAMLYRQNEQMAKKLNRCCLIQNPRFAWQSLPPKTRAELLSVLIYDEMVFENQTLSDCLQQLSDRTSELTGRGLSSSIFGPGDSHACFDRRISLKFKDITLGEILKYLGDASDSTIELNEYGIRATYGKPPEKKP